MAYAPRQVRSCPATNYNKEQDLALKKTTSIIQRSDLIYAIGSENGVQLREVHRAQPREHDLDTRAVQRDVDVQRLLLPLPLPGLLHRALLCLLALARRHGRKQDAGGIEGLCEVDAARAVGTVSR